MRRKPAEACVLAVLAAVLLSAGCKEDRSERVAASYSTVSKATEHPPAIREPQRAPEGIDAVPVEEDYEVRAAASITEVNLKAKLAELQQERF